MSFSANKRLTLLMLIVLLASLVSMFSLSRISYADSSTTLTTANFTDLSGLSATDKAKLDVLLQKGVFNGESATEFGINQNMNRAQFAKVAAIVFSLNVNKNLTTSSFTDVKASDPANGYAVPYIAAIKSAGITNGVNASGTQFDPSGTVTREQLATFLIRGLGLESTAKSTAPVQDSTVDSWAAPYVALAIQDNLMANVNGKFDGTSPATRYTLAIAAYATLAYLNQVPATPTTPVATPAPSPSPSSSPSASSTPVSPKGKSIAIVGRVFDKGVQKASEDQAIAKEMQKLGFRTTYVDGSTATVAQLNKFSIVYFSPTINEKYINQGQMKGLTVPQVYGKYAGIQGLHLADQPSAVASSSSSGSTGTRYISFTDAVNPNPIETGLSSNVAIFADESSNPGQPQYNVDSFDTTKLAKSAIVFANPQGNTGSASIFGFEKGAKAEDGSTTNARIIFYLQRIGLQNELTSDGYTVMDNAVLWALQN